MIQRLVKRSGVSANPVAPYASPHEQERANRRAVGTAAPAAAPAEAPHRPPRQGPLKRHRRHPLGAAHGQPLAPPAGAVRPLEDRLRPLLPLATGRGVAVCLAAASRREGRSRLIAALGGQHAGAGAPARRRSQGGDPAAEVLGRSRGGLTTKIHLRAERCGKPMVVILTEGQRHEEPVLPTLMERGAATHSARPGGARRGQQQGHGGQQDEATETGHRGSLPGRGVERSSDSTPPARRRTDWFAETP